MNLSSSKNSRYIPFSSLKDIIEASLIDKELTLELINKLDPKCTEETKPRDREYLISLENIKPYVKFAQTNKEIATQLLNKTYTTYYGEEKPYLQVSKEMNFEKFVEQYNKNPELAEFLINYNTTDYNGKEVPKFSLYEIVEILENSTDKNKDFVIEIVNKKSKMGNYDFYNSNSIINLTKASNIDLETTQEILNDKTRERAESSNSSAYNILQIVTIGKGQKELVSELLNHQRDSYGYKIPTFLLSDIISMLEGTDNEKSRNYLRKLLKEKDNNGQPYYSGYDLCNLIELEKNYGIKVLVIQADISADADNEAITKMVVSKTVEKFGSIDVVANFAGGTARRVLKVGGSDEFPDVPIEVYDWGLDVNLKGPFYFAHAVLPQMRKQKGGLIINIGSITGAEGDGCGIDYPTAKAGLMYGLTKSIAQYGAKYGIRCVCVSPGPVLTRTAMAKMKTLLGRAAEPQEIIDLCLFLASEKGQFINGENIMIDGGRNAMGRWN